MARMLSGLLLLLHLLISQNEVMHVEAAVCEAKSKLFHGVCSSDSNCARICEKEGFLYGHCKGVLMRCLCYKDCKGPPPPPPGTPPCGCPKPPATPPPPPCGCHNPPATPPPPSPPTGCPRPPKASPPGGCPKPPVKS